MTPTMLSCEGFRVGLFLLLLLFQGQVSSVNHTNITVSSGNHTNNTDSSFAHFRNVTVCSEEGNTTCSKKEHRVCISWDGNETCGNCSNGYLEWPGLNEGCEWIDNMTWSDYLDYRIPNYNENDTIGVAERTKQLHASLHFISAWMSQIPPPDWSMTPTRLSADSYEDYDQISGTQADNESYLDNIPSFDFDERKLQDLPDEIDWVERGAVTFVKDQGRCGACWSMVTAAAIEGAAFITNTFIESISNQQLVSCNKANNGCTGGTLAVAMMYATGGRSLTSGDDTTSSTDDSSEPHENTFGGMVSYRDYPYTDKEGVATETCDTSKNITVQAFDPRMVLHYYGKDEGATLEERLLKMKQAVAQQPVAITIKSQCEALQSYGSGVMEKDFDCACDTIECIDHAVLIVGYNDNYNPPYFKIKNSWGRKWGENGYFRVAQRGNANTGQWGLFGLLGMGIVPQVAVNVTGQIDDDDEDDEDNNKSDSASQWFYSSGWSGLSTVVQFALSVWMIAAG